MNVKKKINICLNLFKLYKKYSPSTKYYNDIYYTERRNCMNKLELAISSIEYQRFRMIYPIMKAFHVGTIFEELNLPWGEFK